MVMNLKSYVEALQSGEDLMLRQLHTHLATSEYNHFTNTEEEEWRTTLRETAKALIHFFQHHAEPESVHVEEAFEENPIIALGVFEAKRQRERGVQFNTGFSLVKYIHPCFVDMLYTANLPPEGMKQALTIIQHYFDKFELGFCSDWVKHLEEKLHIMSVMDELTGLYNRQGFFTFSQRHFKLGERSKKNMLLLYIDFDGMKEINDRMGSSAGDEALKEVASVLRDTFRESDMIGRIGGDEFAVLCIETTDMVQQTIGKRLQHFLNISNSRRKDHYNLSLSVGMAHYNAEKPASLNDLMAEANKLMHAKKRMKNR